LVTLGGNILGKVLTLPQSYSVLSTSQLGSLIKGTFIVAMSNESFSVKSETKYSLHDYVTGTLPTG
jgi:hypothetical protein